jgi:hypothetical protein
MSTSKKTAAADRHQGGPGSSHQREDRPDPAEHSKLQHGEATSGSTSKVSGGGGERDRHHGHDGNGNEPDRSH